MSGTYRFVFFSSFLVGLAFAAAGSYLLWLQHRQLLLYRPVMAVIERSRVSEGTRNCRFSVRFRYEVDGQQYTSRTLSSAGKPVHCGRQRAAVAQYPSGKSTIAYYDPTDPAQAYLIRRASFIAPGSILVGVFFVIVGWWVGRFNRMELVGEVPAPRRRGDRYALRAVAGVERYARSTLGVAVVWIPVTAILVGDYVWLGGAAVEWAALMGWLAVGFAVYLAGATYYYSRLRATIFDASVVVSAYPFRLGTSVTVEANQRMRDRLRIQDVQLRLVCERHEETGSGRSRSVKSERVHDEAVFAHGGEDVRPGQPLETHAEFALPADAVASTPMDESPRYEWRIELLTRIADGPDYQGRFPVLVE